MADSKSAVKPSSGEPSTAKTSHAVQDPDISPPARPAEPQPDKVSYASLPNKGQLALLCVTRFADPLYQTSIAVYMFYQLKFFNPALSDSEIAIQAGLINAARAATQVFTGIFWGRFADSDIGGRKSTLVIGLISCSIASLGYGFSRSFGTAIAWQIFGGLFNANVSMVRCVMAELNPVKRYRTRALLLLPLSATAGQLAGPLVGGLLSAHKEEAIISGYPYAPPNILIASFYAVAAIGIFFHLEETLESIRLHPERTLISRISNRVKGLFSLTEEHSYSRVNETAREDTPLLSGSVAAPSHETAPQASHDDTQDSQPAEKIRFRDIWTSNVCCTMLSHFIIAGHLGTFSTLWAVFLSTPVEDQHRNSSQDLLFSGGLGLAPRDVGIIMSILGATGVLLQMVAYPKLQDRYGTIPVWRAALLIFPLAYIIAPLPALAETISDPHVKFPVVVAVLGLVLLLFVAGRTGSTPATSLLINDCTPHPSVRGTVHTAGTVVGHCARTIFPILAFWIYGQGLEIGMVGLGFWCLAFLAILAYISSRFVKEGDNGGQNA